MRYRVRSRVLKCLFRYIILALSDITQFIPGRFCGRTSFVALKIAWAHDRIEFTARL